MPDIIIGGDFNLPHVNWPECTPAQGCPRDEQEMALSLHNLANELMLSQIITKPTHYQGNTLDLVFTNSMEIIHDHEIQPVVMSISHHSMINITTQYKASQTPNNEPSFPRLSPLDYYNFHSKETKWDNIRSQFNEISWHEILNEKTQDDILNTIYEKTLNVSKENVPLRKKPATSHSRQKRLHLNLARRRRRVNKQFQKATSQTRRDKLHKELIQIEVKIQRLQNETN